ncbi:MAG: hypothetical protein RMY34_10625 [Aulosira sp. DedQUE10]|nr:hypothetical protein [Aulosira sp. DedQUE10]
MNIKHFPFHLGLSFTFTLALITCQTSQPASAQYNGQSDGSGVIVTTGDITGGTFSGTQSTTGGTLTTGDINGNTLPQVGAGRGVRQIVVFAKPYIQNSLNQTALQILNQLSTNNFTSQAGQAIPLGTQQILLNVLTESVESKTSIEQITQALSSVEGSQQLAKSLEGLLQTNKSKKISLANGRVNAIQLVLAMNAYNNLINNSSAQFLNNPPPELKAIQSVLLQLVNSVSSARR